MMEDQIWDELPTDCLADILGRVGIESLILDIPFVSKSWYKASLNPLCWKQLDFSFLLSDYEYESFISRFESRYGIEDICEIKLLKFVISRSAGCATYVKLASLLGVKQLSYVADNCPALKTLVIQSTDSTSVLDQPSVIGTFKNLEMLATRMTGCLFIYIAIQFAAHYPNFTAFNLVSERNTITFLGDNEVKAVITCLSNLKVLTLKWVYMSRQNVIKLLKGCLSLVHLDLCECYGFDANDKEILKLASHIPTFKILCIDMLI